MKMANYLLALSLTYTGQCWYQCYCSIVAQLWALLLNLLTKQDGNADAGMAFMKKKMETSVRSLYGDHVANSMGIFGLI
jgi:hypothetical protein